MSFIYFRRLKLFEKTGYLTTLFQISDFIALSVCIV